MITEVLFGEGYPKRHLRKLLDPERVRERRLGNRKVSHRTAIGY